MPSGDDHARVESTVREGSLPALAITIDDLPWVGPLPTGWSILDGTERIMSALAAHDATATGFVNCGRVRDGAPVLRRWLDAGHSLGNHTEQHLSLNRADPDVWSADARRCDEVLRELTGEPALPFRYPYLHRGPTEDRYRAGRATLAALGSVIAPVSIDTGDWIIDDAYVAALRADDGARADTIATAFIEHVMRAVQHYQRVAEDRVGEDIAHILLLHANALVADQLDPLLARITDAGFTLVPLDVALRDTVYSMEDDYIGPEGLSWLYRIPPAAPELSAWDRAEADALRRLSR